MTTRSVSSSAIFVKASDSASIVRLSRAFNFSGRWISTSAIPSPTDSSATVGARLDSRTAFSIHCANPPRLEHEYWLDDFTALTRVLGFVDLGERELPDQLVI